MDYKAFFADVLVWIGQVNHKAVQMGMEHSDFWLWVADSSDALCKKYQEHRMAIMQMVMLVEWLEEVYESRRRETP